MATVGGTEAIDAVFDDMVDRRRSVHRHPELGFHEQKTTALIRDHMAALGIAESDRVLETGGIFTMEGGRPGHTVVLRADIDALPVQEDTTRAVHSEVEGLMHACGHDVHVGALLGVASALSARREEVPGRFVFLFQPAEEALCGAKRMVEKGALDAIAGGRLVGFHVTSQLPVGMVALASGISMAEAHSLRITLEGPGGHGAMPTGKGDVVIAVADLVSRLKTVVEGLTYEGANCVCTAGMLSAGTAVNVVPTTAMVAGTLRTFTPEHRDEAFARLRAVCAAVGDLHELKVELVVPEQTPAVVNDAATTLVVETQAKAILGQDKVLRMPPMSPSDDVSEFLNRIPGCYFFVGGAASDGSSGMHHSPTFAVEDESLRVGASVVLQSALALATP
jgi:amidohydrolase